MKFIFFHLALASAAFGSIGAGNDNLTVHIARALSSCSQTITITVHPISTCVFSLQHTLTFRDCI